MEEQITMENHEKVKNKIVEGRLATQYLFISIIQINSK